ncbi:MAG: dTDP-4-dehydrorhamnose 3,5-epimerase family protein [bacterium]|nr:dTDP-4-dehydrorhamnose 3,5-epimerase family protein [bacterium]
MNSDNVIAKVKDKVTTQDYTPTTQITGVEILELKEFVDDGGSFLELARLQTGLLQAKPDFTVRQINFSLVQPGGIKAFHLHYNQNECWFVPPAQRLLLGLYDVRQDSATAEVTMRLALGGHKARLVFIPAGVAHGVANLENTAGNLIYLADQNFSLEQPDEQRLPYDILGADFWQRRKE